VPVPLLSKVSPNVKSFARLEAHSEKKMLQIVGEVIQYFNFNCEGLLSYKSRNISPVMQ
jgi:hypothetical protein